MGTLYVDRLKILIAFSEDVIAMIMGLMWHLVEYAMWMSYMWRLKDCEDCFYKRYRSG